MNEVYELFPLRLKDGAVTWVRSKRDYTSRSVELCGELSHLDAILRAPPHARGRAHELGSQYHRSFATCCSPSIPRRANRCPRRSVVRLWHVPPDGAIYGFTRPSTMASSGLIGVVGNDSLPPARRPFFLFGISLHAPPSCADCPLSS